MNDNTARKNLLSPSFTQGWMTATLLFGAFRLTAKPAFSMTKERCIVSRSKKSVLMASILKDLHWLPVKLWIDCKCFSFTYSCFHRAPPQYLSELILLCTLLKLFSHSHASPFQVVMIYQQETFSYLLLQIFSSCPSGATLNPQCFKNDSCSASFKSRFKTHPFSKF